MIAFSLDSKILSNNYNNCLTILDATGRLGADTNHTITSILRHHHYLIMSLPVQSNCLNLQMRLGHLFMDNTAQKMNSGFGHIY